MVNLEDVPQNLINIDFEEIHRRQSLSKEELAELEAREAEEKARKEEEERCEAKRAEEKERFEQEKAGEEALSRVVPNPNRLFDPKTPKGFIEANIYRDMDNLVAHEAGTKWMRVGTLLSFNATQQIVGAGFKAIMDQNKILIRQNELIYRELKKLNKPVETQDTP